MIVVGYLYNNNGMATWCIETCLALHKKGLNVILVKSKKVVLPDNYPVNYLDFDIDEGEYQNKFSKLIKRMFDFALIALNLKHQNGFLKKLEEVLILHSIKPYCYLLNQSNLFNKYVKCDQYVVAWSSNPTLWGYLKKILFLKNGVQSIFFNIYNAIYWYRVDWYAYSNAKYVLSVSDKLTREISNKISTVITLYPCINSDDTPEFKKNVNKSKVVNFVIMALKLEEKRKGIREIVRVLKSIGNKKINLKLIGDCSDSFKDWVLDDGFSATFTGVLSRQEINDELLRADVFLFGSIIDDWGYVQLEAMSKGLIIVSPRRSPFDEIVGNNNYLYDNMDDLRYKLTLILQSENLNSDKAYFLQRFNDFFSSYKFSNKLLDLIQNGL